MYSKTLKLALATAFAGIAVSANAATATNPLAVSATVKTNCSISATNTLPFGQYDPVSATALNGTGSFTVACTKNTASNIGMGLGTHAVSTQRNLSNGTDTLQYNLFRPSGASFTCSFPETGAWGNTIGTDTLGYTAASNAVTTIAVCGTIPAGQDVPNTSTYTDSVTITVNF